MLVQETTVQMVKTAVLHMDAKCQMRDEVSWQMVQEYAEDMEAGDVFPPLIVFHKAADRWYVADGFHRLRAALKLGLKEIKCEVRHGGLRDAILYAVGANAKQGMRRSNADKHKAVLSMLSDREWKQWNDAELGRRCNVSSKLVQVIREKLIEDGSNQPDFVLRRNGSGNIVYRPRVHETRAKADDSVVLSDGEVVPTKTKSVKCPHCGTYIRVSL